MNTLPMHLDWLWFLDYDLDRETPLNLKLPNETSVPVNA